MRATIDITGIGKFKLQAVSFGFNQMVDQSGRPTSEVLSDQIALSIFPEVSEGKEVGSYKNDLFEWMIDGSKAYDGKIEYFSSEKEDQPLKVLTFEGAFCVSFSESMTGISNERIVQNILIAVATLKVDEATYVNMWRKGMA